MAYIDYLIDIYCYIDKFYKVSIISHLMQHKPTHRALASLLCSALVVTSLPIFAVDASVTIGDPVLYWNAIVLDTIAQDANETYGEAEQNNPGATSRALGMFHGSIFDAVNSITRTHNPYLTLVPVQTGSGAIDSAVAYAAHGVLSELYPNQQTALDAALTTHMSDVPDSEEKELGEIIGRIVATAILDERRTDGSEVDGTYTAGDQPGQHRVDPLNPDQSYWGPTWGSVTPFTLTSSSQFRAPEPPAITSQEYADAYNEVKALGGDNIITPSSRTEDQTEAAVFWAYDGSKLLGTPPRFYNQIARTIIADQGGNTVEENARLFALMNLAVADAGISAWDSKFHYGYWRPIIGIREAEVGTGPSGLGDGNPDTEGDPTWTPLSSPASNQSGQNFTPPFPTYPSGHATFGAAAFGMLRNYYGTDDIAFEITSDEFNGVTTDTNGNVRPHSPRSFASLSEAAEENGMSRVYLGIHWNFDSSSGIDMGTSIADYAFANMLQPANLPQDPCENGCITVDNYDLSPSISAPASAERDSTFHVTFQVNNAGPGSATGVVLTANLPENITLNSALPADCSVLSGSLICSNISISTDNNAEIALEFTIPPENQCPSSATFEVATSENSSLDYNENNNTSEATVHIECEPENDIRASLRGPSNTYIGEAVLYEATIINDGPAFANNPVIRVPLETGMTFSAADSTAGCNLIGSQVTCSLQALQSQDSATVNIAFIPLSSLACGTDVTFTASASSGEKDTNTSNNTSSDVHTEMVCNNSNDNDGPVHRDLINRDTVGNSQSPGSTRGKGTTEAQFVLNLLTQRNGMGGEVSHGGHYRLSQNAQTLTRPQFVASDRVVITNGYTNAERNIICGMRRYIEEQDPRNRKTDAFKTWLISKIANDLHHATEEIHTALSSDTFCQ